MKLGPSEILIIVLVVGLLFGSSRIPKLARSLREARREFEEPKPEEGASSGAEADAKPEEGASSGAEADAKADPPSAAVSG
jgi:sec-independent protein translocase protein TatA